MNYLEFEHQGASYVFNVYKSTVESYNYPQTPSSIPEIHIELTVSDKHFYTIQKMFAIDNSKIRQAYLVLTDKTFMFGNMLVTSMSYPDPTTSTIDIELRVDYYTIEDIPISIVRKRKLEEIFSNSL